MTSIIKEEGTGPRLAPRSKGDRIVALQNLLHTLDSCNPYPSTHDTEYRPACPPLDREANKGLNASGGSIFGPVDFFGQEDYRWRVDREVRRLLPEVDKVTRERFERRVKELYRCGKTVAVRTCSCCGEDRPESGSFAGSKRTCRWKACPYCSWTRAKKVGEFYQRAAEEVQGKPGDQWQMLTITTRYNPRNPAELTWQALRSRSRLVLKAARVLWQKVFKKAGAAMFRSIECSMRGHVHCHLLYLGPEVDAKALTDLLQVKVGGSIGYLYVKTIEVGDEDDLGNTLPIQIGRTAKYMAKGTFGYGTETMEGWFAFEENAKCINPRLAARWEIATYKLRMTDRYGELRGVSFSEADYKYVPPDDSKACCQHCGVQGEWETAYRRAEVFIQDMHIAGHRAMEGSSWVPWWRRKKRRLKPWEV